MALASVEHAGSARAGAMLLACVAEHGTAAHPYAWSYELLKGPDAWRNLADFVHFLCVLHGRQPGVIDHAASRAAEPLVRPWFAASVDAFAAERAFLTRLAVAAGPLPSTPGAGDSDAAVLGQRHAVEMLAQSERNGCSLGAAFALALDWSAMRVVLDAAAMRFHVDAPGFALGAQDMLVTLADEAAAHPPVQRAMLFGAEQIVLQHKGLWDLLEARQLARSAQPA